MLSAALAVAILIDRPLPRSGHALVYDARKRAVILINGDHAATTGEVWAWSRGGQWRQVSTDGPGIRNHHAMAYDKARGVVVLFGGQDRNITLQRDTWEWDGESWSRVATSGPTARVHHALVYDDMRQRVLLYGGSNQSGTLSDFWE